MNSNLTLWVEIFSVLALAANSTHAFAGTNIGVYAGYPSAYGVWGMVVTGGANEHRDWRYEHQGPDHHGRWVIADL